MARLIPILRFLGKVQFTMVLLIGGALIMTVGTLVESRESREVAWSAVYGTIWFDAFLFAIGVNLLVAVVNRIPIQRHQWGFVLTHFSIVLLLAGAWVSRTFGYEGRMAILEGREESRIFLESSEIRTRWRAEGTAPASAETVFPLPQTLHLAGRELQRETEGRPGIRIAEYLRDGVASVHLGDGGERGEPGVGFALRDDRTHIRQWLIAGDRRFQRRDLGPVEVEFRIARDGDLLERRPPTGGIGLVVPAGDGRAEVRIPLPASVGREIPCGGGLVARVTKFLLRARMVNGALTEVPTAEINPAAVVEIASGSRVETHTVFSNFPDFEAVHRSDGHRPLVEGLRLDAPPVLSKPRISILLDPGGPLYLQLATVEGRQRAQFLPLRRAVAVDPLGLEIEVERFLERAEPVLAVSAAPAGRETGDAYLRLEARLGGSSASRWLRIGQTGRWRLEGGELEMGFAHQSRPLPFAIALEDFELVRHPGSRRPAEYRSRVRVLPADPDLPARDEVISMNRPLDVAGFRLFQSSYQLGRDGAPDATVLSVSRDPGVRIVYTSFALIIAGIAWYVRRPVPVRPPPGGAPRRGARPPRPRAPAPDPLETRGPDPTRRNPQ